MPHALSTFCTRFLTPLFSFALIAGLGLMLTGQVTAQTATFTFQGRLTDGAATANGTYEMQFSLYSVLSGPGQIGSTITNSSVPVVNGVFTVNLDFSPATPFATGADRWIEIAVRKAADPPGFTTLSPRQQVTSSPFSTRALSTGSADSLSVLCTLCVTDVKISDIAGSKVTGTVASATTAGNVSGVVAIANGGTGSATGDASGLTNIIPANIAPGTAPINIAGIAANPSLITSGTTPSAAAMTMLVFNYASPTVVTDLTGGIDGQCVTLLSFNTNVSIIDGGNFKLSANWTPLPDGTLSVCRSSASGGPFWYETARSTNADQFTLSVGIGGIGSGTVTSSPAGISCEPDCSELYISGTVVTLTASPAVGSTFTGWSGGGCSGTGTCVVTMTAAINVDATFDLQQFSLSVSRAGTGTGSVTSSPAGINCGADCTETYNSGTMVTLTASPTVGSIFTGWSGDCAGTGACVVTMTAARSVTANFTLQQFTLTATKSGTGSGTVTSSPAGINCGGDCTEAYNNGTVVVLTANASSGSTFTGWSGGGCSGTGSCVVTVTAATSVNATFTLQQFTLTVTKSGNGTVTSSPAGINCGGDCTEAFNSGTVVTLTASPGGVSSFTGWSGGGCSGTGTCVVTVLAATTVNATFVP